MHLLFSFEFKQHIRKINKEDEINTFFMAVINNQIIEWDETYQVH